MENEFNCTLFIRQLRGIIFTSQGEALYQCFCQLEQSYQRVKETISTLSNHPSGTLNIACSNVFSKYHMPHILSQFKKLYPQIEVHLKSGFSHYRYREFLEGKFHVCIIRGDHSWAEHKRKLWQDPLCIFSKYPLQTELLPSYPYIHYVTDPTLQGVLDEWWYAHFSQPPLTTIETDAMDTNLKMVQEDLGFTLLSKSCGQDFPDLHTEPLINKDGTILTRDTWMYYRNNYEQLTSVKAFVDFINEQKY